MEDTIRADIDEMRVVSHSFSVLSHRWYAADGINLESPELQVVRAFRESENYYYATGSIHATYPGYSEVAPYPTPETTRAFPEVGTIHYHVIDVRQITGLRGRPATRVVFCQDRSGTAEPDGPNWRTSRLSWAVSMTVSRAGQSGPIPETDPAIRQPTPTRNIFEGWNIDLNPMLLDTRVPENGRFFRYCNEDSPIVDPTVEYSDILTTAPEVEPFTPSWPTALDTTTG